MGVQRKWIQHEDQPNMHFDISISKRTLAIKHGAKAIGMRELAKMTWTRRMIANGKWIEIRCMICGEYFFEEPTKLICSKECESVLKDE